MPPLPVVNDVLRSDFLWSDSTDVNVSTRMYFEYDGGAPSASDCMTIAEAHYAAMAGAHPAWVADTQLTGVTVTDLSSHSGAQATAISTTAGTNAGTPLAGGTCAVVGYSIARRYRGGKPRSYFPWGSAADLLNRQQWTSAFLGNVHDLYAQFLAAALAVVGGTTAIEAHVNVSYYQGNTALIDPRTGRAKNYSNPRAVPVVDQITAFTARPTPGSQRRRNRA